MKRIYLLLFLAALSVGSFAAPRSINLKVTMIKPTASTPVTVNVDFPVQIEYKNMGPDSIKIGDTLVYTYTGAGGNAYGKVMTVNKAPNDTIAYSANFHFTAATNGNLNFCWAAIMRNGANIGTDPDTTNNTSCNNIVISGGSWPATVPSVKSSENNSTEGLTFAPNPANSEIIINYTAASATELKARVVDITGRVVLNYSFGKSFVGQTGFKLDVSSLNSGIYFVQLSEEGRNAVGKLIKQ